MEKKLTDEKAMFNYVANTILGEVKPLYLRKRIVNEILDLIQRLQDENKRLSKKNGQCEIKTKCENTIFNEACLTVGIVKALGELEKQKNENAELQKQVNEQDKEIDRLEKVVHEQAEQYYDCEQRTAVEILQKGRHCMPSGLKDWIKERYGVEVE